MKFNMNVWLKMYHHTNSLHPVHDSKEIDEMMKKVSYYLDACGMFMPPPLWQYDPKDITTWKWIPTSCSDPNRAEEWTTLNPDFAYEHLCT